VKFLTHENSAIPVDDHRVSRNLFALIGYNGWQQCDMEHDPMADTIRAQWTAERILDFLASQRIMLKSMGVKHIGLFGSYVRDEQRANSDLDFLVQLEPFTFQTWMDLWNFLEDTFQIPVDLVPEKDLRAELRPHVLSEVRYVQNL
jgi:predicted nucleotidyltransferase